MREPLHRIGLLLALMLAPVANTWAQGPGVEAYRAAIQNLRQKQLDQSLAKVNEAIQLEPTNARYYYLKGYVKQAQKDTAGAQEAYRQSLERDPGNGQAYLRLAQIAQKQGNAEAAITNLNKAYQNETDVSNRLTYKLMAAELQSKQKRYEEALASLEEAKEIAGGDSRVPYYEGKIYEAMEKFPEAAQKYEIALNRIGQAAGPELKDKYNARYAVSLYKAGQTDKADEVAKTLNSQRYQAYYKKQTRLSGSKVQLFYAMPYVLVGEYQEAMKYVEQAIETGDMPGYANMYAAQIYQKQGQNTQAIAYLNQAINNESDSGLVKKYAGMLLSLQMRTADYTGAISTAERLLNLDPGSDKVAFLKAQAEYQSNRYRDAMQTLESLLARSSGSKDAEKYRFLLGLAAQKDGDMAKAKEAYASIKDNKLIQTAAKKQMAALTE